MAWSSTTTHWWNWIPSRTRPGCCRFPRVTTKLMTPFTRQEVDLPSPYWGDEVIFQDFVQPNHLTMDDRGRVWASAAIRKLDNPAFCKDGSSLYSKLYPVEQGRR